jgi:hypothetical protein
MPIRTPSSGRPVTRPSSRGARLTVGQSLWNAAKRWHIPLWALVGVKLAETGNGGKGTANPFQLEPATASSLGVRDVNNFDESANGAARLLSQYHRKYGNWNSAFEAYNGGPGAVGGGYAYGEAHIRSKLQEFGLAGIYTGGSTRFASLSVGGLWNTFKHGIEQWFNPHEVIPGEQGEKEAIHKGQEGVEGGIGGIGEGLAAVGNFFTLLVSVQFWIRVGEVIGGAILLYMGLKNLTGVGVSDIPGAKAAKVGGIAAVGAKLG